jgi:hypothetical protein
MCFPTPRMAEVTGMAAWPLRCSGRSATTTQQAASPLRSKPVIGGSDSAGYLGLKRQRYAHCITSSTRCSAFNLKGGGSLDFGPTWSTGQFYTIASFPKGRTETILSAEIGSARSFPKIFTKTRAEPIWGPIFVTAARFPMCAGPWPLHFDSKAAVL